MRIAKTVVPTWLGVIALVVGAAGCDDCGGDSVVTCSQNADCESGVCVEGECRADDAHADGGTLDVAGGDLDAARPDSARPDTAAPDAAAPDAAAPDAAAPDAAAPDAALPDADQPETGSACEGWLPVGSSELVPWTERLGWGSATAGGVSNTAGASQPVVALDALDQPVVAWRDNSVSAEVYLRRWQGAEWIELQGSASFGGVSDTPATQTRAPHMALDASDHPVMVWAEGSGARDVYLRAFDGAAWRELGGSATGGGISGTASVGDPALAVDGAGGIHVVWSDSSSGTGQIYLRFWDGGSWLELGGSATGGGISNSAGVAKAPVVAIDALGRPVVAWQDDGSGVSQIYARVWDGDAWVELAGSASGGGVSDSAGTSLRARMAAAADGSLCLLWLDDTPTHAQVYLKRYSAGAWSELAGSASGQGVSDALIGAQEPALALDAAGRPTVVWTVGLTMGEMLYLRRWDGVQWEELDGSGSADGIDESTGLTLGPSVAIDSAANPVVVWWGATLAGGTMVNAPEIYLLRWSGAAWEELGHSPQGGGLSDTPGGSLYPALALDAAGLPMVAWWERNMTISDVYFRRWDGASWAELGGSGSNNGLSDAGGLARNARVAVDAVGRPIVAWAGGLSGELEAYLARWEESAWAGLGGSFSSGGLSSTGQQSFHIALALGPDGAPVVAWEESAAAEPEIYLRRWDGLSWQELGGSASDGGISASPDMLSLYPELIVDALGRVVLAWTEETASSYQVRLLRWQGEQWRELDGSGSGDGVSQSEGEALYPQLGLDASDEPLVAWAQGGVDGTSHIRLKRFNGATWVELGGSASGAGVPGGQGHAESPDLATDRRGNPILVWADAATGLEEILVQRWTGAQWLSMPELAGPAGISNSSSASVAPSVAVEGDEICVAWSERGANQEILLRCSCLP